MFVNEEGIKEVPTVPNKIKEGYFWFTRNENTAYVFIIGQKKWEKGRRRNFILKNLRSIQETEISVLGQNDKVVEYWPDNIPESKLMQHENNNYNFYLESTRPV